MSNNYGPRIVTDGLICCLDAADRNSYPGSGSTWYDLSGNGNNGIFGASTAAPAFSTIGGGSIVFGGDDYISLSSLTMNSYPGTISLWFSKPTSNNGYLFSNVTNSVNRYYIVYSPENELYVIRGTSSTNLVVVSSSLSDGFHNIVLSYDNSTLYTYLDGSYVTSASYVNGGSWTNGSTLGAFYNKAGQFLTFLLSSASFYDRILSANEVQQNYNATKGRFGL